MKLNGLSSAILFQGTKQNPPSLGVLTDALSIIIIIRATSCDAMDRKVTITQTLAQRTQWDSNTTVIADGTRTLLDTASSSQRCKSWQPRSFERNQLVIAKIGKVSSGCGPCACTLPICNVVHCVSQCNKDDDDDAFTC